MTRKVWKCAPLLVAIVASGLASQAHAVPQAYAVSYDNVFNGQVVFLTPFPGGNLTTLGAPVPASGSAATFNGSGPSLTDPLDAQPAVAGAPPGAVVNNAFVAFGQNGSVGSNYGWGDSHVVSQQTVGLCSGPTCFHAVNEGESSVTNGRATGDGNVGSGTFFILTFVLTGTTQLDLSLNATPYAQVFLDNASLGSPDQASATLSASATIINTTNPLSSVTVFNFAPDGTGPGTTFGGMVLSDPFSLNVSLVSSAPGGIGNSIYNPCGYAGFNVAPALRQPVGENPPVTTACPGSRMDGAAPTSNYFHVLTNGLPPGTYQLRLAAQELTNVQRAAPEPTSITLLGLGLAALGLMGRRKHGSRAA